MRANKLSDERVEVKRRVRMTREMQRELEMAERLERVGCLDSASALPSLRMLIVSLQPLRCLPLLQSVRLLSLTALSPNFFSL